jgi:hypothetical protein
VVTYIAGYGMPTQQDSFRSPYGAVPPAQPYQQPGTPPAMGQAAPSYGQPAATWSPAPATSAVPAGWQADPTGRNQYRYWDGRSWTADVSNSGMQAVDPV